MRVLALAGILARLVAPVLAAEQSIVGTWYEDVTYGGQRVISVWTLKADGTFAGLYRHCLPQHGEQDTTSSGHWTYASGHLRTREESGTWPIVDEYQTESNDGHVWVYRGVAGPDYVTYGPVRFRDLKVEPGSKVPTCDLSS